MGATQGWITALLVLLPLFFTSWAAKVPDELDDTKLTRFIAIHSLEGDDHTTDNSEGPGHDRDRHGGGHDCDRGYHHCPSRPDPDRRGRDRDRRCGPGYPPAGASLTIEGSVFCSRCTALDTPMFGAEAHLLCPHPHPPGHGGHEGYAEAQSQLLMISSTSSARDGSFHLPLNVTYANYFDRCSVIVTASSDSNCDLEPHSGNIIPLSNAVMKSSSEGVGHVITLEPFSFKPTQHLDSCGMSSKRNLLQSKYIPLHQNDQIHVMQRGPSKPHIKATQMSLHHNPTRKLLQVENLVARSSEKYVVTIPPVPAIPRIPTIPPIPAIPPIPTIPAIPPIPPAMS